jgi:hypothetical protein
MKPRSKASPADNLSGKRAYCVTLLRLREVLENAGVEFIDAVDGVRGVGVCLKWGVEAAKSAVPTPRARATTAALMSSTGTGRAPPEDDEPLPPLDWTDEDRAEQIEH